MYKLYICDQEKFGGIFLSSVREILRERLYLRRNESGAVAFVINAI
ncbi:MAG: hypothetical protein WAV73_02360 [Candidatus Moraniibacteriota bacterium]